MNKRRIGRREALQLMGATVAASGITGCAAAGRVVLSVAWRTITKVVSAVFEYGDKALTVVAIVEKIQEWTSVPVDNPRDAKLLMDGAKLYLKTTDGQEHEVLYKIKRLENEVESLKNQRRIRQLEEELEREKKKDEEHRRQAERARQAASRAREQEKRQAELRARNNSTEVGEDRILGVWWNSEERRKVTFRKDGRIISEARIKPTYLVGYYVYNAEEQTIKVDFPSDPEYDEEVTIVRWESDDAFRAIHHRREKKLLWRRR